MSLRCLIIFSDAQSCATYRLFEPMFNLKTDIEFMFSKDLGDAWTKDGKLVDIVLMQRPVDKLQLQFIKEFKKQGKIIICETDDDLENVPYTSPVYPYMYDSHKRAQIYSECMREANFIHVSTPQLVKSEKYHVFMNAIDLSKYDLN